jgi:hypothetical protein
MPATTSGWPRSIAKSCQTEHVETYRPGAARYRGRFGWVLPAMLFLALLVYWRFDQPTLAYVAEMIVVFALVGVYVILYFRNTRFIAQPHSLTVYTALGMSHTVAQHHLANAILIEHYVTSAAATATSVPRLLLLDDEGRSVLRWSGHVWTENQMRDLVATLELPLTEIPGRLGSGDIHRRYPRALGMWESHPVAVAVTIIAGLAVVSVTVLSGLLGAH